MKTLVLGGVVTVILTLLSINGTHPLMTAISLCSNVLLMILAIRYGRQP